MKKHLLFSMVFIATFFFTNKMIAQTQGTLTFSMDQVAHTGSWGAKHVLAIWIQNSSGTFVKTRLRYWGGGTNDHLPTWKSNSSSNITDATTGATLTSYGTRTFTWDGKNSSGVDMPDGDYKITIEETWSHGSSTVVKSYTFTKGGAADVQTPADDTNFKNVSINWTPVANAIEDVADENGISVFPSPTSGLVNINFKEANEIKIINITGKVIYQENINNNISKSKLVDLSNFANGIYFVNIINGNKNSVKKIVLNK